MELLGDDHVDGHPDAPHVLVMYGDFECPFCQAAQSVLARVKARMGDELRFVYRHFPLREVHPLAQGAAEASEHAAQQGRFWPMYEALYAQRGRLSAPRDLERAAEQAGVDATDLPAALADGRHRPRVQRDVDGGTALGVAGTPAFFANGVLVAGAFDARSLVDALRAGG